VAASIAAIALIGGSEHTQNRGLQALLIVFIGWAFIGTGLFAWWRRASSRVGALMVAVGFAWLTCSLTAADSQWIFTLGVVVSNVYFVLCVHLLLAYPSGRLQTALQRRLVAVGYGLALIGPLPALMLGDLERGSCDCPGSAIQVARDPEAFRWLNGAIDALGIAIVLIVVSILVSRWRSATSPQRRAMAPVLWSGVALLVMLGGLLSADGLRLQGLFAAFELAGLIAFASVPFAFLFGLVRLRVQRAGAVSELLVALREEIGSGDLRDLLAGALGDESLELGYHLENPPRMVNGQGRLLSPPEPGDPGRGATEVEFEGVRVGAIIHDPSLCDDPELLRSVAAAAGLAMQNGRLQAELRVRVEELRASRARLIEAGVSERRRLERDLHDGAQQRLVALSLTLRLAQNTLRSKPQTAETLLSGAQEELALALSELRELARGIHPAVLSDRGLEAALDTLAARSPVPVEIEATPDGRLPEPVEAAVYFLVSEALTNMAKHAHASRVTIRVGWEDQRAVVEVSDDGMGGADPDRGSGLAGLTDRIGALDGRLEVDSPPGGGTRLRAEIPCDIVRTPSSTPA
jgi:signal transduction histidine kinase